MANYVGLDLGTREARVLEVEGSAKKMKLIHFAKADLGAAAEGPQAAMLEKEAGSLIDAMFAKQKISREPLALSWDSGHTIFRELDLPFKGRDQINKVIKYEAESHLLNCDIDDVVVSHYALAEEREKSHLMVMAARKDQLLNRFDILGRAGLDPLMVDLDVMSAFNALDALGYTKEHKSFMVLDCGRTATNLMLIVNGRLKSGRAIRIGSDSMTVRLAKDLDADPAEISEQSQELLKDPAARHADDLVVPASVLDKREKEETAKASSELAHDLAVQQAADFHSRVSREVRRTLATALLQEPLEVVYVTGPGSLSPGFAEGLADKLGLEAPLEPLKLLERVEHKLDREEARKVEAEICTALGLTFKLAGHDATGVDFRQEECRYARRFDQLKEPLIYFCFFLMFMVLLQDLLDAKILWTKAPFFVKEGDANISKIHKQAFDLYRAALGSSAATLPSQFEDPGVVSMKYMITKMEQRISSLKANLGRGGAIPELKSAVPMWRDCFDQIQLKMGDIGKLFLDNATFAIRGTREPYIELEGAVPDYAGLDDLLEALRAIPGIATVEEGKGVPTGDLIRFSGVKVVFPQREEF
ncbi:MAG: pilus assembly protein PilM [Planctomycetota bacterium]